MAKFEHLVGRSLLLVDSFGLNFLPIIDWIVAHSPITEENILKSTKVPDSWQSFLDKGVSLAMIHPPDYGLTTIEKIIAGSNLGIAIVVVLRSIMNDHEYKSVGLISKARIPTIVRGFEGFDLYQHALETLNDHFS